MQKCIARCCRSSITISYGPSLGLLKLVISIFKRRDILKQSFTMTKRDRDRVKSLLEQIYLRRYSYNHAKGKQTTLLFLSCNEGKNQEKSLKKKNSPCTKLAMTLLPVCSNGCPTTICRNRCNPSRRCSITSSENRFVKTLPGSGGIVTRALSRSRISLKCSKSE